MVPASIIPSSRSSVIAWIAGAKASMRRRVAHAVGDNPAQPRMARRVAEHHPFCDHGVEHGFRAGWIAQHVRALRRGQPKSLVAQYQVDIHMARDILVTRFGSVHGVGLAQFTISRVGIRNQFGRIEIKHGFQSRRWCGARS